MMESVVNTLRKKVRVTMHLRCDIFRIIGSTVEVFTDTKSTFTGLMFQDNLMKSVFSSYPEVLLVNATYKLVDLRMPVYLIMCIEGKGQGKTVLVFLAVVETEESRARMVQVFKSVNPQWTETKVVMSDKDFNERTVFRRVP